ncbi:Terminase RNaseH-like domain containing protein [uncultured Caudovirales phage]|uniref:Terminase RNaseH-like domain containing protein n=1 Tax=uncultured Caudovirales phage TaxID=2100421 RepID=A0A6J5M3K6_9CAUD|nr:Terminase RNaseH-like domain containing protein [uncultured Caudovirales phage]
MTEKELVKQAAEADLLTFIRLVAPHRVLGAVHEELCAWWQRQDAKDNQLVLLPRDHQKSAMIAYRVAHHITKHPEATVLYVSATANLAEKQLKAVKDILLSDIYRFYWPEMVNEMEGKRERWAVDEISVDHPKRKAEGVRDATIKAAGITANVTGLHCSVAVLDDVVVPDNAYTQIGRDQVRAFYSQLSSIESTGAKEWAVGTRYHPGDLYKDMMEMSESYYDEDKDEEVENEVYETFERVVETNGEFLWPKQRRTDGKTFGFDQKELARKKAKYLDITQFYAQYYNNPNAVETQLIDRSRFTYYERDKIENFSGAWYFGDKLLHVYAAMDFAYTVNNHSDYTVIAVVGVDEDNNYYILDIDRFKTNKISIMYDRAEAVFRKWRFKKMRCEIVAAQRLIVSQFRDYMRSQNIMFTIDEYNPPRTMNKAERIASILEPRYTNNQIWHYKGGNCQILEEELVMNNPEHDDVKDAVAACVEICKSPVSSRSWGKKSNIIAFNSKFGGVAY